MRIVRAPHRTGFTQVANRTVEDPRLSFKALGLLVYLLSRPPGWETDSERLATRGADGRDAIRSGLRELVAAGYMTRSKRQGARGRWETVVAVHEQPVDEPVSNPVDGSPTTGFPTPEKPTVGPSGATTNTKNQNPPTPASGGASCRHRRPRTGCAGCGPLEPVKPRRPVWCGVCDDEATRLVQVVEGGPLHRCPTCHPLRDRAPLF